MDSIHKRLLEEKLWDGNPVTEPETDIDEMIDDYETIREMQQDDKR